MLKQLLSSIAIAMLSLPSFATEYQTVQRPRQECWNEQVPTQSTEQGYGGVLLGGLAGGVWGHQVGGGRGKTAATAMGAVAGAMVGDRIAASTPTYSSVRRCRTVMDLVRVPVYAPDPIYYEPAPVYYEPVPVAQPRVYFSPQSMLWQRQREERDWEEQGEHGHDRQEHGRHGHEDQDD